MSTTPPPDREGKDDHDLLTFGEAGVRLDREVRAQQRVVAVLQADGGAALEAARARLDALRDAAERNRRQPINDRNFESFFGYLGGPRRNT
jgi:hypothetical protein